MTSRSPLTVIVLTAIALIAFAANSVLSRLALDSQEIDAASFTSIRLISGIITLLILVKLSQRKSSSQSTGSWLAGFSLFVYAIAFSYAYLTLETGTGALVLFGSVQITMVLLSIYSGTKLHPAEWVGILLAFLGLVYLMLPQLAAPSATGFVLMALAGIAWGIYTLSGRGSQHPLSDTAYNFLRTLPFVLILLLVSLGDIQFSAYGILLAALSGSLASGVGYSIWYAALAQLSSTQAAVLQLLVPVIAAVGGVVFVAEPVTLRLAVSGLLVIGGILIVVLG